MPVAFPRQQWFRETASLLRYTSLIVMFNTAYTVRHSLWYQVRNKPTVCTGMSILIRKITTFRHFRRLVIGSTGHSYTDLNQFGTSKWQPLRNVHVRPTTARLWVSLSVFLSECSHSVSIFTNIRVWFYISVNIFITHEMITWKWIFKKKKREHWHVFFEMMHRIKYAKLDWHLSRWLLCFMMHCVTMTCAPWW
jgi:hypothetical protein